MTRGDAVTNDKGAHRRTGRGILLASMLLMLCGPGGCGGGGGGGDQDAGTDVGTDTASDAVEEGDASGVCASDEDCDDGDFCNGEETCDPDTSTQSDGCVAAESVPCLEGQTCDEDGNQCLSDCDLNPDADGDGFDAVLCGGDDCDDADGAVNPDADEIPGDEEDQNCDGAELCFVDVDDDGYRTGVDTDTVESENLTCEGDGEATADMPGGDCDDYNYDVSPEGTDLPGDGLDSDCDGQEECYVDSDGDGYRSETTVTSTSGTDCSGDGEALDVLPGGDCDDDDVSIHPDAEEGVGDNVDQNCDGIELCYLDADQDGYLSDDTTSIVASDDTDCFDLGEGDLLSPTGDCDDAQRLVNPGQSEIAGDGRDQNCDGQELCYIDADGDGYRPSGDTIVSTDTDCDDDGEAPALSMGGDCNDADPDIHPFNAETCDNVDEDCDTVIDESVYGGTMSRVCGTNTGRCRTGTQTCSAGVWSDCEGDIEPITEWCDAAGNDEDCDGSSNEGCACTAGTTRPCGPGTDVGACENDGIQTCYGTGTWGACVGAVYPAEEECDGVSTPGTPPVDEDCDGEANEEDAIGCTVRHVDLDGDGHGDPDGATVCLCGLAPPQDDCDDSDPDVYPGNTEECNGVDDDCDGSVDERDAQGCTDYFKDADGDGYGNGDSPSRCYCSPVSIFKVTNNDDCCDVADFVHPGSTTWSTSVNPCGNFDNNCDHLQERRYSTCGDCDVVALPPCDHIAGWNDAVLGDCDVPSCGHSGKWVDWCAPNPLLIPPCIFGRITKSQQCR